MTNIAKTIWILSLEAPQNIHIDERNRPIMHFDSENETLPSRFRI